MPRMKNTPLKLAALLSLGLAAACGLGSKDSSVITRNSLPGEKPSLTITPLLGRTTETTEVYLSGPKMSSVVSVSFTPAAGSSGGGDCTDIKLIDETSLKCKAPAAPGGTVYSLKLTRQDGEILSLSS